MKKKGKNTYKIIIILLAIILGLLFIEKNTNNTLKEKVLVINQQSTITNNNNNEIQTLRSTYHNNDIIGLIKIKDTNIEEPILKYTDNDYYLTHDNYGNNNSLGSIFMDYRTNINDKKILIYGHSSTKREVPFNELENYYSKDFYENHKEITLIGENETFIYEIFSVYVETKDFTYMNLKIDDTTYNNDLLKYKQKSLYDTKIDVSDNDQILILQTCSNHLTYKNNKRKYLLIIAKRKVN